MALVDETLAARARVFAWAAEHPEAMARPVLPQLMLCGLPRPGTTYLSFLFGADPHNRTLRYFEAPDPAPCWPRREALVVGAGLAGCAAAAAVRRCS